MPAQTQYRSSATDLEIMSAMVRADTLVAAGEWLGVDTSTIFRSLQCIECGLGATLSAWSRTDHLVRDLTHALVERAEQVESALEAVRSTVYVVPDQVPGTVRITTMDIILANLVVPVSKALQAQYPHLRYDPRASNELASLTRCDADIAVQVMHHSPQHLVGKRISSIRARSYTGRASGITYADVEAGRTPWVAVGDAIPDHPSVGWRRHHFPKAMPMCFVDSLLIVVKMVGTGVDVGILLLLMAQEHRGPVSLWDLQDINRLRP